VNLTIIQNYGDAIIGYSTGVFNGIFIVYPDTIIQQSSGVNTKVVYNLDSAFKADVIVDKGNNLSDVKGKKIGVDGINSFSHFFCVKILRESWTY
jgi:NitT/TauT family transport system substrate-binding protein